jgi:hypothetical protein
MRQRHRSSDLTSFCFCTHEYILFFFCLFDEKKNKEKKIFTYENSSSQSREFDVGC